MVEQDGGREWEKEGNDVEVQDNGIHACTALHSTQHCAHWFQQDVHGVMFPALTSHCLHDISLLTLPTLLFAPS